MAEMVVGRAPAGLRLRCGHEGRIDLIGRYAIYRSQRIDALDDCTHRINLRRRAGATKNQAQGKQSTG
jgi:hypothetical protein